MSVFGAADSAKREMAAYRNMVSHPGYQFALAQGMMAANMVAHAPYAAFGMGALSVRLPNDYAGPPPINRLSVIRKYGFGGRR